MLYEDIITIQIERWYSFKIKHYRSVNKITPDNFVTDQLRKSINVLSF